MIRYVEANKLWEEIDNEDIYTDFESGYIFRMVREKINNAPTADVEEVKHGYWKMCYYPNDEHVECSECHTQYYENDLYLGGNEFPKRCPECGAYMDKEKEE